MPGPTENGVGKQAKRRRLA